MRGTTLPADDYKLLYRKQNARLPRSGARQLSARRGAFVPMGR